MKLVNANGGITADGGLLCRGLAALQSMGIAVAGVHSTALRLTLLVPADRMIHRTRAVYDDVLGERQPRTRPLPTAQ